MFVVTYTWKILLMQMMHMLEEFAKILELNHLGQYCHFFVQNDILMLPDVSENFRNIYINIYELYPGNFFQLQN